MTSRSPGAAALRARGLAAMLAVAAACGCQATGGSPPPVAATPVARSVEAASRYEAWIGPRLDAVQAMLETSHRGVELVSQVLRARQPGAGVDAPDPLPARAYVAAATARARRSLEGSAALAGGDAEQQELSRDVDAQVARMLEAMGGLEQSLPGLAGVGASLGPLGAGDNLVLGASLARLLALQVRADSVFAALVVGLLTPESDLLPERELQAVRRGGNDALLDCLGQLQDYRLAGAGAQAGGRAVADSVERQLDGLEAARLKLEALRGAARGIAPERRRALDAVLRSYDAGIEAELDFLGTLAGFSRLVHAVDRAAPDAGPGIAAAIDGARRVTARLAARLQANLERLAVLDEIGAGRRT
ncbi:MAG: hypothetical protein ACO3CC_03175 [Alphaproteobacteria bacterium]